MTLTAPWPLISLDREADAIAAEQVAYWARQHWTPEDMVHALTGLSVPSATRQVARDVVRAAWMRLR